MTTRDTIRSWLVDAKRVGATHVVVVCDTFDHGDYPVNVMPGSDVRDVFEKYNGHNMQRVMEVYALHLDIETQLNEHRAKHFEAPPSDPELLGSPCDEPEGDLDGWENES